MSRVVSVARRSLPYKVPVYNLEVSPQEAYFANGVAVHNCSTWWIWRKYRARSGKNMADELQLLHAKGYRHFVFEDDAMTIDRQKTLDLCAEIVSRDMHIAFFATTRVDAIDDEVAEALKEAGCYGISFGLESGSLEILERIGKRQTLQDSKAAVAACRKAGLAVCALMIVGNIGETDKTINESVDFLLQLGVDDIGTVGSMWILPGTEVYRYAKKKGMINDDFWLGPEPFKVFMEGFDQAKLSKWHGAICMRRKV